MIDQETRQSQRDSDSKEVFDVYQDVIDKLGSGLQSAEASQDDFMKAKINAKLGQVYNKWLAFGD